MNFCKISGLPDFSLCSIARYTDFLDHSLKNYLVPHFLKKWLFKLSLASRQVLQESEPWKF